MSQAERSQAERSRADRSQTESSQAENSQVERRRAENSQVERSQAEGAQVERSRAEKATPPGSAGLRPRNPLWTLGLLRSEITTLLRRHRTYALLAVLAAVPVLIGIAVRMQTGGGGGGEGGTDGGAGPAFLAQVTNNGFFLVFAALAATLPVFLPMAVGVVAGDAIAGEASGGTLRYLLVAPAGRTRLLLVKYASVLVFCLVATLVVAVSALAVGALLFPVGDVTTISGTRIGFGEGLVRAVLVVAVSLTGFAALGLFVSTLTGSGIGAMAATVGLLITAQILDSIPQLSGVHPYLFAHYWMSFADVLREPVHWDDLSKNFQLQGLYVAVFGSAAWARFTAKDITA
ncbi:ABC transporter permease [Streptomyces sp. PTY087I2]|uniref:ABC transporter permease n=1 Tax=Streptomyces sp. PTY087I2 TaxID=1819298 RepID=UPI000828664C|nr:ABC transporter permease [Streptomyces sp. PTY087I2]OCC10864.1 ABC-2 family transporter protein [Streptomyces sp. PTY087I2]